jgi:hypothetical protein
LYSGANLFSAFDSVLSHEGRPWVCAALMLWMVLQVPGRFWLSFLYQSFTTIWDEPLSSGIFIFVSTQSSLKCTSPISTSSSAVWKLLTF